jgi:hypothetical protein
MEGTAFERLVVQWYLGDCDGEGFHPAAQVADKEEMPG